MPKSRPIMLRDALKKIIEHANGKSPFASYEYKHGLAGFDAWIQAFNTRKIDPFGNAYNLAVVTDARQHAENFFAILSKKWDVSTELDQQVIEKLTDAKESYRIVATYFHQLQMMFPFPHGGEPNDYSNSQKAIELLQHAFEWESKGIKVLKELEPLLEKYEDSTYGRPYVIKRKFEFAGLKHHALEDKFDSEAQKQMYELMKRDESILSRITNIKLIAYEQKPEAEKMVSYIVARPVHFKPYNLPYDIHYYNVENSYACIRVKLKKKKHGYETLKNWMAKEGMEQKDKTYTIEFIRPPQHRDTEEELEIYIPINIGEK